ncbi:PIN domain-containing protein, partial [Promineifilum sp.]|uniref:type II toxin-antitoxin system VapC family toxin n=1 Tax=Promineifilum sp. TaxID=2664178 RepID=UPI0031CCBC13
MRIYLDTAPVIYLVEHVEPYLSHLITRLGESGLIQVCGELTRLETRVKPIRLNDAALLMAFDSYFSDIIEEVIPLTRVIVDHATELRARYNFRTPDALQVASAIGGGCDYFLTNDSTLQKCTEIKVEV